MKMFMNSIQLIVDRSTSPMTIRRINDQLLLLERSFLDSNGLPHNSLKKHIIFSPSETAGSAGVTSGIFPGLMDIFAQMLAAKNWQEGKRASLPILKAHLSVIVFAIDTATNSLRNV